MLVPTHTIVHEYVHLKIEKLIMSHINIAAKYEVFKMILNIFLICWRP